MFGNTYIGAVLKLPFDSFDAVNPMMAICIRDETRKNYKAAILLRSNFFYAIEKYAETENLVRRLIDLNVIVEISEPEYKAADDAINAKRKENGHYRISSKYFWKWLKWEDFRPWIGVLEGDDPPLRLRTLESVLNKKIKFVAEYIPSTKSWDVYYYEDDKDAETEAFYLKKRTKAMIRKIQRPWKTERKFQD